MTTIGIKKILHWKIIEKTIDCLEEAVEAFQNNIHKDDLDLKEQEDFYKHNLIRWQSDLEYMAGYAWIFGKQWLDMSRWFGVESRFIMVRFLKQ